MLTSFARRAICILAVLTFTAALLYASAASNGKAATPEHSYPPTVDGLYRCDDASVIKLRWTKPMPKDGWLGEITTYEGGRAVTKGMQAYNPIYSSSTATWGYQTWDGKVLCRTMQVLADAKNFAWRDCRNWKEQGCTLIEAGADATP